MQLFDVYPLQDVTIEKALGSYVWDKKGEKYLDFYGGHAVISVGHSHPHYVKRISEQLNKIGFYSNSVHIPIQQELAEALGEMSGYGDYSLFLCNSGAEANENALKIASFSNGRKKIITFRQAFHGRTSGTVSITDNPKIVAPFNSGHEVIRIDLDDFDAFEKALDGAVAAVIIEGIQGVGGIRIPSDAFLEFVAEKCKKNNSYLILDEIQSGYGRSGKFFAHQYSRIRPDLITVAKGMANGFPVGAVLISPEIKAWHGMLGTTFGGNYLACAASLAVLEIIKEEKLLENTVIMGDYLMEELRQIPQLSAVRGKGLMIGLDLPPDKSKTRENLLSKHKIFTGEAKPHTIRLLPALTIQQGEADLFLNALKQELL